jgi:hypothetical protein
LAKIVEIGGLDTDDANEIGGLVLNEDELDEEWDPDKHEV